MKNVKELFNELRGKDVKVSKRRGEKVIAPKELSAIKQDLMNALVADFAAALNESEFVGVNENGVVVEIMNDFVDSISFEMNPKIKSLEFDAYESVEAFNTEQKAKHERAEQRKKDAKAKFTNAKAKRESTAR